VIANRMPKQHRFTLAQYSNFWPITAQVYDLWRERSLSLLTRERFTLAREFTLMVQWLEIQPGEHYLDVGTSTGNYARALAQAGATVTAIDIARPMLEYAHKKLKPFDLPIQFEQASAEALPYPDASFDGIAMGGSLNEFYSTRTGLLECARVLKPGGKFFLMYLCQSDTPLGRLFQLPLTAGVRFPDREVVRQTLLEAGLERRRAEVRRAVTIELFIKTDRKPEAPKPGVPLPRPPGKPQREPLPE
jgi:2-polyprenyl-6-hydroxyphenyl methylase/3-demethylubiquinone-9 3-methyltransferase